MSDAVMSWTDAAGSARRALATPHLTCVGEWQVEFGGERDAEGGLTWSQRFMWNVVRQLGRDDHRTNTVNGVPVPEGVPARQAIGRLLSRHETLRTIYSCDADGEPRQRVTRSGRFTVPLHHIGSDADVDAAAWELGARMVRSRFHFPDDWPARFAVVTQAGVPAKIVYVLSHLSVDTVSADLVRRALIDELSDRAVQPNPAPQPLDLFHEESSPSGRALRKQGLRHWQRRLRSAPQTMFAMPAAPAEEPRWRVHRMSSSAVRAAAHRIAVRDQASVSSVLLAGFAAVLGHRCGSQRFVTDLVVSNRGEQRLQSYVGCLSSHSIVSLDLRVESFSELLRDAYHATIEAHIHGHHDRIAADTLRERHDIQRGISLEIGAVNYSSADGREPPAGNVGPAVDWDRLTEATTVESLEGLQSEHTSYYLRVVEEPNAVIVDLMADTCRIPSAVARRLLRALQTLLVTAAARDVAMSEIAPLTGVAAPIRGPDQVLIDHSWVDLRVARRLLRSAADPAAGEVFARAAPDGETQLVGYVVPRDRPLTPELLHLACCAALPGFREAITPTWYVVCDHAPADLTDQEQWARQPVVAQGTGRPQR